MIAFVKFLGVYWSLLKLQQSSSNLDLMVRILVHIRSGRVQRLIVHQVPPNAHRRRPLTYVLDEVWVEFKIHI